MKPGSLKTFVSLMIIILCCSNAAFGSAEIPLTVDEAVSLALEENLNLKLQKNEVAAGQGSERIENGVFDPRIEAGISTREQGMTSLLIGGAEKERSTQWTAAAKKKLTTGTEIAFSWENDLIDTDSTLASLSPSYSSAVGLSVTHPLVRGNSRVIQTAGLRAAEKYTEAAVFMVEDQAADLAAQVKNAYWDLVFALQDIEVKKLSLKLAMNLRDETSRKIESGLLASVEIYQPESEIARREELLIAAERDIADAEDSLKMLINVQEWNLSIIPGDIPEPSSGEPDLQAVLTNVISRRPDIKAAGRLVDGAEIMARKAEDDLKPSLALSGAAGLKGYGENYGNSLDDAFSDPTFTWQLGLTFQLPLGNETARGNLARAQAELIDARLKAELLRQEATREAREAARNVTLAIKTIEATRKTSLASQKRLEAEQAKFNVGLATANDVLEFQDSYARALISEKRALIDLARARVELDRVQGIVSLRN